MFVNALLFKLTQEPTKVEFNLLCQPLCCYNVHDKQQGKNYLWRNWRQSACIYSAPSVESTFVPKGPRFARPY